MIDHNRFLNNFSREVLENVLQLLHNIYFDAEFAHYTGNGNYERWPNQKERILVQAILSYLKESSYSMTQKELQEVYDELSKIEWRLEDEDAECIQTIAKRLGKVSGLKILYVYGHLEDFRNNAVYSLRKAFPELKFICEKYSQENFDEAVEFLSGVIEREKIDLVIGPELGGFIALNLQNAPKVIALDPCMNPYEELPAIRKNSSRVVFPKISLATYKTAGDQIWNHTRGSNIMGCFSEGNVSAELLDRFEEHFGEYEMISHENGNLKDAIPAIGKCIKRLFPVNLPKFGQYH